MSKIEWTDRTWNPITGCSKISEGCRNCYAEVMTRRLCAMGVKKYENGFDKVTFHEDALTEPLRWKKPSRIFVCSMSDLFHENVPYEWVDRVMETIVKTPQHTYQILTKRAERMQRYLVPSFENEIPKNIWIGTTVENKDAKLRMIYMTPILATVNFLSCEPLLDDLGELDLRGIDWVIVGGESGPNARPMKKEWVLNIKRQCDEQGVPFFFKQWGTYGEDGVKRSKKANGHLIDGQVYQAMPEVCNG